jgi:type III secretion system chaperone SycN
VSTFESVFADFGRRLGAGAIAFDGRGPLTLDIDGDCLVTFERAPGGGELLATLSWPLAAWDRTTLPAALKACSLEASPDWAFQAGLAGDRIALMARLPEDSLDAPAVESLVLRLHKIRQALIAA